MEAHQLFDRLDVNKDGRVDEEELREGMPVVQEHFPREGRDEDRVLSSLLQVSSTPGSSPIGRATPVGRKAFSTFFIEETERCEGECSCDDSCSSGDSDGEDDHDDNDNNNSSGGGSSGGDDDGDDDTQLVVEKSDDGCVMCQYIVSKVTIAVHRSGVLRPGGRRPNRDSQRAREGLAFDLPPKFGGAEPGKAVAGSSAAPPPAPVFLQMGYQQPQPLPNNAGVGTPAPGYPYYGGYGRAVSRTSNAFPIHDGKVALPITVDQPDKNQYWDSLEWNLANNLNHVADLSLDDVCESSMPNEFYPACKVLMGVQDHMVNLIGRQFKPEDVCTRLKMCTSTSYLSRGIHTPGPTNKPGPGPHQHGAAQPKQQQQQPL